MYRETRNAQTDELIEALYPRHVGVTAREANKHLATVADITVEVHYDVEACKPFGGPIFLPDAAQRSVRWADLDGATGEEDIVGSNYSDTSVPDI